MRLGLISAVAVGILAGGAAWGDTPDPRKVIEAAQNALRAAPGIQYQGRGEVQGPLAQHLPQVTGKVTMVPDAKGLPAAKVRIEAQVIPPGQTQAVRFQLACDGKSVAIAEHSQRLYLRQPLPEGGNLLDSMSTILVRELAGGRAFEAEQNALKLEHAGVERVGEFECDVIHAVYRSDNGEARWAIARADHLPRRVERIVSTPTGKTTIRTTIESLSTGPVEESEFQLEKPAGFDDPRPARSGGLQPGTAAPEWTLPSPEGKPVSLRDLRGKVVLLDFWATWCGPCRQSMPHLQKLHEKYKDKPVIIFGVNCWERSPSADPAGYMKQRGLTYPLLLKGDKVAGEYGVRGIPAFCLIGPDGKVLLSEAGFSPQMAGVLEQAIERALGEARKASAGNSE